MHILSDKLVVILLLLAASVAAAEQPSRKLRPPTEDPFHQHFERGVALEKIGLQKEAEAEYLAALDAASPAARISIMEALQRVREAQRSAKSVKADKRSEKNFQLGEALQGREQYDEAAKAFQRAYDAADSREIRARAQAALISVLEKKNSFWQEFIQGWFKPVAKVLLLLPGLYFLYWILRSIGGLFAPFSKRIEVADFEDTTDTGFGKGFPALLRALYQERQQLARSDLTLKGSGILTYRSEHTAQPIIGSRNYEDFSAIKLDVAGVAVSELLSKATRLLRQPRYSVGGVVYRYGNEIRAVATLTKYNAAVEHWEFTLWDGQPGGRLPSDSAYQVIGAIIKDWG